MIQLNEEAYKPETIWAREKGKITIFIYLREDGRPLQDCTYGGKSLQNNLYGRLNDFSSQDQVANIAGTIMFCSKREFY